MAKQTLEQLYKEAIAWMIQGASFNLNISVDKKEMQKTQEYFKDQISKNENIQNKDDFFNRINWKIE